MRRERRYERQNAVKRVTQRRLALEIQGLGGFTRRCLQKRAPPEAGRRETVKRRERSKRVKHLQLRKRLKR